MQRLKEDQAPPPCAGPRARRERQAAGTAMKALILAALLASLSLSAFAEGPATSQHLMKNKQALFEGIYRLQDNLEDMKFGDLEGMFLSQPQAAVIYDWDHNRLTLEFTVHPKRATLATRPADELCVRVVEQVREHFVIHRDTGTRLSEGIVRFFNYKKFGKKTSQAELMAELEAISVVKVTVATSDSDSAPFKEVSSCENPLSGTSPDGRQAGDVRLGGRASLRAPSPAAQKSEVYEGREEGHV